VRGRNGLFVKLSVNGTQGVWATLDTGCPITAVDPAIAEKLKLKKVFNSEVSLYGGSKGFDLCETDVGTLGVAAFGDAVFTADIAAHKCWIEWLAPEELGRYLSRITNEAASPMHGLPMIPSGRDFLR
jgi:hypothetical protein